MFDRKRAEKNLIIFLTLTLLLGTGILLCLRSRPPAPVKIGHFSVDKPSAEPPAASSAAPSALININEASAEDLVELKGVGKVLARRIVEYRAANGRFLAKEEITRVRGVGPALYEKIKSGISVE